MDSKASSSNEPRKVLRPVRNHKFFETFSDRLINVFDHDDERTGLLETAPRLQSHVLLVDLLGGGIIFCWPHVWSWLCILLICRNRQGIISFWVVEDCTHFANRILVLGMLSIVYGKSKFLESNMGDQNIFFTVFFVCFVLSYNVCCFHIQCQIYGQFQASILTWVLCVSAVFCYFQNKKRFKTLLYKFRKENMYEISVMMNFEKIWTCTVHIIHMQF